MMSNNIFLTKKWQNTNITRIRNSAKGRYHPELNVSLPFEDNFNALNLNETFLHEVRTHYGNLKRERYEIQSLLTESEVKESIEEILLSVDKILHILKKIKSFDTFQKVSWEVIGEEASKLDKELFKIPQKLEELRKEILKDEKYKKDPYRYMTPFDHEIHNLRLMEDEIYFFNGLAHSEAASLSNKPYMLLTGIGGSGKTHLLCKITEDLNKSRKPSILLFAENFTNADGEILDQIVKQSHLETQISNPDNFLKMLDEAARSTKTRFLISIDAINETTEKDFWKNSLPKFLEELKPYKHIALCLSIRSSFEDIILTEKLRDNFITLEHTGFKEVESDAIETYFKAYGFPLPEIPVFNPEFSNPLFLYLFCETYKNYKKSPPLRGGNALKDIFEHYVKKFEKKLLKQFTPSKKLKSIFWDGIMKDIASWMIKNKTSQIDEHNLITIIGQYFSANHLEVIKAMESETLLLKLPYKHGAFDLYKFTYNKFSDHLIVRTILKIEKDETTRIKSFDKRRRIGRAIKSFIYNEGIIEALCIQTPEFCKGKEFFELYKYSKKEINAKYILQSAFTQSLIWRQYSDITPRAVQIVKYDLLKKNTYFLDTLLTVAPIPNHKLNATFLHEILKKLSMSERDSWWSIYISDHRGYEDSIDRILIWGNSKKVDKISYESRKLISIILIWFLCCSDRIIRDKATKALVNLLTNQPELLLELLNLFIEVDDMYLQERLYAVTYGCILRSKNGSSKVNLKKLATFIYENVFIKNVYPPNILLKDYARLSIEEISKRVLLKFDLSLTIPPYNSEWDETTIPKMKFLKNHYYPHKLMKGGKEREYADIWFSIMSGDFARYIIGTDSHNWYWSSKKLHNVYPPTQEELYKKFIDNLSTSQKELWDTKQSLEYHKIIITEAITKKKITTIERSTIAEGKKATEEFISSLTKIQEKDYHDIVLNEGKYHKKDEYRFDLSIIQRFILNRVIELGWKPELHGEFDTRVSRYDRGREARKPERIGKKYQWIAYYEVLERMADNFQFVGLDGITSFHYDGGWQLSVRNIDPTTTKVITPTDIKLPSWWVKETYDAWKDSKSLKTWIQSTNDLPLIKKILNFKHNNKSYLLLEVSTSWKESIPPEEDKHNYAYRDLSYHFSSYLVHSSDLGKLIDAFDKDIKLIHALPQSPHHTEVFLREYWNSLPYNDFNDEYYGNDHWTKGTESNPLPVQVLSTCEQYNFQSSYDASIDDENNNYSLCLPAKYIVEKMGIKMTDKDSVCINDKGKVISFDPYSITNNQGAFIVDKSKFEEFLSDNKLSLLWRFYGSKHSYGQNKNNKKFTDINGYYYLSKASEIKGNFSLDISGSYA